jgi:hypothetical protein
MVVELVRDDPATATASLSDDGLLAYLGAHARLAHAPVASHWCTPGHNRGAALAEGRTIVAPQRAAARAMVEEHDERHAAR